MTRITLKDIAGCCGVTPTLVSAVLNRRLGKISCSAEKKKLIEETALRLGYRPNLIARSMVSRNVPVVALMLHLDRTSFRYGNSYFTETASQLMFALQEKGLEVLMAFFRSEEEQIERFHSLRGNGLIGGVVSNLIPAGHSRFATELRRSEIPYALLGHSEVPALCIREKTNLMFLERFLKTFRFKNCYLLQHIFDQEMLFPFRCAADYDRFQETSLEATPEVVEDPANLIVCLGAVFLRLTKLRIASPFILEHEYLRYQIPSGVPYALLGQNSVTATDEAARMVAEWMRSGKSPEEREYLIPADGSIDIHWEI